MRTDIAPIQMLRGIAAAMVVCVHIQLQLSRLGFADVSQNWLLSGVDIFFVISGFIMWVSIANRPERTAAEFMRHRIARIVPLYWLLTTLMIITMLVRPDLLQSARYDLGHIIKSYLFIAAPHPTSGSSPRAASRSRCLASTSSPSLLWSCRPLTRTSRCTGCGRTRP